MKIREFFKVIIDFATLRKISLRGFVYLFGFYCLLAVAASPIIYWFSREPHGVGEYYCYQKVSNRVLNGVGVKKESSLSEFVTYFNLKGDSMFLIPDGNSFIKDTMNISPCTTVKVINYTEDSLFAYVKAKNGWYNHKSRIDSEFRLGYVPKFLLHLDEPVDCF
ncbi:MAG: hypothetical protein ACOYXT_29870 [Bacteroidota bacterium]